MKKTLTLQDRIDITARKWFDKINGNTYHAVRVIVRLHDGTQQELVSSHLVYGYGDCWKQTAAEMLEASGYCLHASTVKAINKTAGYDILRGTDIKYSDLSAIKQHSDMVSYVAYDNCLKRELRELVS